MVIKRAWKAVMVLLIISAVWLAVAYLPPAIYLQKRGVPALSPSAWVDIVRIMVSQERLPPTSTVACAIWISVCPIIGAALALVGGGISWRAGRRGMMVGVRSEFGSGFGQLTGNDRQQGSVVEDAAFDGAARTEPVFEVAPRTEFPPRLAGLEERKSAVRRVAISLRGLVGSLRLRLPRGHGRSTSLQGGGRFRFRLSRLPRVFDRNRFSLGKMAGVIRFGSMNRGSVSPAQETALPKDRGSHKVAIARAVQAIKARATKGAAAAGFPGGTSSGLAVADGDLKDPEVRDDSPVVERIIQWHAVFGQTAPAARTERLYEQAVDLHSQLTEEIKQQLLADLGVNSYAVIVSLTGAAEQFQSGSLRQTSVSDRVSTTRVDGASGAADDADLLEDENKVRRAAGGNTSSGGQSAEASFETALEQHFGDVRAGFASGDAAQRDEPEEDVPTPSTSVNADEDVDPVLALSRALAALRDVYTSIMTAESFGDPFPEGLEDEQERRQVLHQLASGVRDAVGNVGPSGLTQYLSDPDNRLLVPVLERLVPSILEPAGSPEPEPQRPEERGPAVVDPEDYLPSHVEVEGGGAWTEGLPDQTGFGEGDWTPDEVEADPVEPAPSIEHREAPQQERQDIVRALLAETIVEERELVAIEIPPDVREEKVREIAEAYKTRVSKDVPTVVVAAPVDVEGRGTKVVGTADLILIQRFGPKGETLMTTGVILVHIVPVPAGHWKLTLVQSGQWEDKLCLVDAKAGRKLAVGDRNIQIAGEQLSRMERAPRLVIHFAVEDGATVDGSGYGQHASLETEETIFGAIPAGMEPRFSVWDVDEWATARDLYLKV